MAKKKKDPNQFQRTFMEQLTRKVGIAAVVYGLFEVLREDMEVGLIIAAVGVVLVALSIAMYNRHLKKFYDRRGVADAIQMDVPPYDLSLRVYKSSPGSSMMRYIRKHNPQAAVGVEKALAAEKAAKKKK